MSRFLSRSSGNIFYKRTTGSGLVSKPEQGVGSLGSDGAHRQEHEPVDARLAIRRHKLGLDAPSVVEHLLHVSRGLVDHELRNRARHALNHRQLLQIAMLHKRTCTRDSQRLRRVGMKNHERARVVRW